MTTEHPRVATGTDGPQAEHDSLRSALSQLPVAVCILQGPGHLCTFANPAYVALVGGDDPVGKSGVEALPKGDREGLQRRLDRVASSGRSDFDEEVPVQRASASGGETGFFKLTYAPRRDALGGIDGVLVCAFDVTAEARARRRAEAVADALRESEEHFRSLATLLPEVVWIAAPDGRFTYVNDALLQLTGLSREELLRGGYEALIHPLDRPVAFAAWQRAIETGASFDAELRVRSRDGDDRWHRARAVPVKAAEGAVEKWIGISMDVDALRSSRAEQQQRADFEQQLIGIVSHDLRNPLGTVLMGVTVLARRETLDEGSARIVARIQSSAERAVRLVKDLLDFTQARVGGGLPISRAAIDVHAVTRQVSEDVQFNFPDRRLEVTSEGDGHGLFDSERVAQVVTNLASNAMKYSPRGTLVTVASRGDGDWVEIAVRNDGAPIPRDAMVRLFQPFQRASSQVDTLGRSVGLGLYIVKHIIEAHQGVIDVQSSAENGTTFTVRLPRRAR